MQRSHAGRGSSWIVRLAGGLTLALAAITGAAEPAAAQSVEPTPAPDAGASLPEPGAAPASGAPAPDESPVAPAPEGSAPGAAEQAESTQAATEAAGSASGAVVEAPGTGLFGQGPSEAAQPAASGSAQAGAPGGVELGGYVRGDVFAGKDPDSAHALLQAGYGELALKLRVPKRHFGGAYAEMRMRYGLEGQVHDLVLDLREAYVDLSAGPLDLRLGQQIIVWGRADAFNPTNNLMPFDLRVRSPIEDDRRVGNVGARAFYNLEPVRIEGVWLPLYIPAEYPPIALDPYITITDPSFPSPQLQHGLGAGRVHLELASFEGSISYLHGYAPLPGLALRDFTVGQTPAEVRITRTAYVQDVFGLDFSTAVSDLFAIRGEAAYRRPLGYGHRVYAARPDVQYVLGVDRAFGQVSVILQYMGRFVRNWRREQGPAMPVDPNALETFMPPLPPLLQDSITTSIHDELAQRNQILFSQTARVQHLATLRVEWLTLHETLSLSALGMLNLTTKEWLLFPKLEYRISDRLRTYLGAEIFVGPAGTLFDLIDEKLTAGYAELRYSF